MGFYSEQGVWQQFDSPANFYSEAEMEQWDEEQNDGAAPAKKGKRRRKNKGSTTNHPDPSVEQRSKFTRFLAEQVQEDLSVQESDGFASMTWQAFLAGCNAANNATDRLTCTVCKKQFDYPLESWGRNPWRLWQHLESFQSRSGHPSTNTFKRWDTSWHQSQPEPAASSSSGSCARPSPWRLDIEETHMRSESIASEVNARPLARRPKRSDKW